MSKEPYKKFPRVSSCCKVSTRVDCADEGTCCYICTKCQKPCDEISNKELGTNSLSEIESTQKNHIANANKMVERSSYEDGKRIAFERFKVEHHKYCGKLEGGEKELFKIIEAKLK